jgi:hypothetical protein
MDNFGVMESEGGSGGKGASNMLKPVECERQNRLRLQDRIELDLIEADVEMGCCLMELAAVGSDQDAIFPSTRPRAQKKSAGTSNSATRG